MPIIWLRRLIRRNFQPIDSDVAMKWRQNLSAVYAFSAMNLFLYVVYKTVVNKAEHQSYVNNTIDEKQPPGRRWANLLGMKNATVMRITGLDITDIKTYEIKETDKNITDDDDDDI